MDAKVVMDFACRLRGVVYRVGDAYQGTPERVAELAEGGYVEVSKPAAKAAPRKRAPRKAASKE